MVVSMLTHYVFYSSHSVVHQLKCTYDVSANYRGLHYILTLSCILSFIVGFRFSEVFTFKIFTKGLMVIPCQSSKNW